MEYKRKRVGYANEMRFIRAIKGKTRWDTFRNEEPRKVIVEYSLIETVQKTRLRWSDQVKRMNVGRISKNMSELPIKGKYLEESHEEDGRTGLKWTRRTEEWECWM